MKIGKRRLTTQRHALDARLRAWTALRGQPIPKAGWTRAIREALGLTSRQLAARMKTNFQNLQRLEQREVKRTVTLASLDRAARAMHCRLVYAIVPVEPHSSLEDIVAAQAHALAQKLTSRAAHSMRLEGQGVGEDETTAQIDALTDELKRELDSRIWALQP